MNAQNNEDSQSQISLPFDECPCSSSTEGSMAAVTDCNTTTWATIAGGGSSHVLAYCDRTHWTVAADWLSILISSCLGRRIGVEDERMKRLQDHHNVVYVNNRA